MDDLTRRKALGITAAAALVPGAAAGADDPPKDEPKPKAGSGDKLQRDAVTASGMTDAEADCWKLAGDLAGSFFGLPEMHPMDKQEVATAIHVIQNKLLSRPTYRRYLEEMKKAMGHK